MAEKDFFGGAVFGEVAAHFAGGPHAADGGVGGGDAAGEGGDVGVGDFAGAVKVGVVESESRGELEHVRRLLRILTPGALPGEELGEDRVGGEFGGQVAAGVFVRLDGPAGDFRAADDGFL